MKNPTKKYMQLDFESVKKLGKNAALLLSYLIYKSGNDNIVCLTRSILMNNLDMSKTEYLKACKILIDRELISILDNHISRMNGFLLHEENIVKFIGSPETYIGSPETYIGLDESNDGLHETNDGLQRNTIKQETRNNKTINNTVSCTHQHEQAREELTIEQELQEKLNRLMHEANTTSNSVSLSKIDIDFTDTPDSIIKKAKESRKRERQTRKPKREPVFDEKWLPFLEFIDNEFSINYRRHLNIAKAREAARKFIQDNSSMTPQDILDMINKIKAHYIMYMSAEEYAVGPVKYLENRQWLAITGKVLLPEFRHGSQESFKNDLEKVKSGKHFFD